MAASDRPNQRVDWPELAGQSLSLRRRRTNANYRPVAGIHERHLSGEPKSLATARRPAITVKFTRPRPGYRVMDAHSGEHLEALRLQDWGRRNASPRAHQIQIRTF